MAIDNSCHSVASFSHRIRMALYDLPNAADQQFYPHQRITVGSPTTYSPIAPES